MAAKCKVFIKYGKTLWAFVKKKYDCKTWNTKGIIDVKEHIWLTNVEYLKLSVSLHGHLYFVYIHICTFLTDIGTNKEKEI